MAFPAAQVDSPRKRDLTCFLVRYTSRGSERLPRVGEFAGPSEAFRLGRPIIHCDTSATTLAGVARVQAPANPCVSVSRVLRTDRGCQYTSSEFRGLLAIHGLVQSLSRPGRCGDNAVAEGFFATLKNHDARRRSPALRHTVLQA